MDVWLTHTKCITSATQHKVCYTQTWNKPVHFRPSPVYPSLQEQLYPPSVLLQMAFPWQLWEPLSHSSTSKCESSMDYLNRRTIANYIYYYILASLMKCGISFTLWCLSIILLLFFKSSCLQKKNKTKQNKENKTKKKMYTAEISWIVLRENRKLVILRSLKIITINSVSSRTWCRNRICYSADRTLSKRSEFKFGRGRYVFGLRLQTSHTAQLSELP